VNMRFMVDGMSRKQKSGIPVTSSNSVIDLGLTVGAAGPLPLRGAVAGVLGSAKVPAAPLAPVAIVTCSTLSKK